jgi:thioredoxin reductase
MEKNNYSVIIVGAGPIGLAAAVHLLKQNISTIIFEHSENVGGNINQWGHVQLFTPWNYNLDELCAIELKKTGWKYPDFNSYPTGHEFLSKYLVPLSKIDLIHRYIKLRSTVTSITKDKESGQFVVQINGKEEEYYCTYLLDCSGTFLTPNIVAKSNNVEVSYKIPDLRRDYNLLKNKRIAVIGTGHSSMHSILELLRLQSTERHTQIYWLSRSYNQIEIFEKERRYFKDLRNQEIADVLKMLERSVEDGKIKFIYPFEDKNLVFDKQLEAWCLNYPSVKQYIFDKIIINCGFSSNYSFYKKVNISINKEWGCVESLFNIINPKINSCLTVKEHTYLDLLLNEPNLFVLGQKSYGKAPSFLLKTGYIQVISVVNYIRDSL